MTQVEITPPPGPDRDKALALFWWCGTRGHGNCFSASHLSDNRVAWEAGQHARTCDCWRHAVLRALGWPTVTGRPGSPHVVFEDASLPHQVQLLFVSGNAGITVSCNCIARRTGRKTEAIGIMRENKGEKDGGISVRRAVQMHRDWHLAKGRSVTARFPEYAPDPKTQSARDDDEAGRK